MSAWNHIVLAVGYFFLADTFSLLVIAACMIAHDRRSERTKALEIQQLNHLYALETPQGVRSK